MLILPPPQALHTHKTVASEACSSQRLEVLVDLVRKLITSKAKGKTSAYSGNIRNRTGETRPAEVTGTSSASVEVEEFVPAGTSAGDSEHVGIGAGPLT